MQIIRISAAKVSEFSAASLAEGLFMAMWMHMEQSCHVGGDLWKPCNQHLEILFGFIDLQTSSLGS